MVYHGITWKIKEKLYIPLTRLIAFDTLSPLGRGKRAPDLIRGKQGEGENKKPFDKILQTLYIMKTTLHKRYKNEYYVINWKSSKSFWGRR